MRLIDGNALYEKTAEWESLAMETLRVQEDNAEWQRWQTILTERTAFKYDVADAPTIDAEPVIHAEWIEDGDNQPMSCDKMYCCSNCKQNRRSESRFTNYCSNCGAKLMYKT